MKKQENQTGVKIKALLRAFFTRLPVAALALGVCVLLILWDMGKIDIPFLKRKNRRDPLYTQTQTEEGNETKGENQTLSENDDLSIGLKAENAIERLYDFSFLEDDQKIIPAGDFNKSGQSLVKTRLPDKHYRYAFGFLIHPDGTVYRASDLKKIPDSADYSIMAYRSKDGRPLFYNQKEGSYFVFDEESFTFVPASFDPATGSRGVDFPMPASYGMGEENRVLTVEDGLFGYAITYRVNKWRNETILIENQYTQAFPYSEGYAVMADEEGRVTIRDGMGEGILSEYTFLMPDKDGVEALGFHYFDHGLLRVVFANYGEDGSLLDVREGVINPLGQEFEFPKGYVATSYYNGVFTLSNGERSGHYSASGSWITHPIYKEVRPFFEGVAVVTAENGKMGLVDLQGNELLPCVFDNITDFSEGTCLVYAKGIGSFLLTRVAGDYQNTVEEKPPAVSYTYSKITITRGPLNTFQPEEEPETLELTEPVTTSSRPLLPEFWE